MTRASINAPIHLEVYAAELSTGSMVESREGREVEEGWRKSEKNESQYIFLKACAFSVGLTDRPLLRVIRDQYRQEQMHVRERETHWTNPFQRKLLLRELPILRKCRR